jgi:ACS family hexuronate transporter-like MFS transporter
VALTLIVFSITGAVCLSWLFSVSVVIAETFPVKNVASVLGIAGGFGAAGAVLFNYTVGLMINTVGAGKLFFVMALLHPLAVIILWKMVGPENPERKYKKTLKHYGKPDSVGTIQILPIK